MADYIPPDAINVVLNFKEDLTGSTALVFGVDEQKTAQIDLAVDVSVLVDALALNGESNTVDARINTDVHVELTAISVQLVQLELIVNTSALTEIVATKIDQFCALDVVVDVNAKPAINAYFDINHIVGVTHRLSAQYQKAITRLSINEIPWSKPILRVSNEAFFYDKGLLLSNQSFIDFDKALSLSNQVRLIHEQATGLSSDVVLVWQETEKHIIQNRYLYDESLKLRINRKTDWDELIRRRKVIIYSHDVAENLSHRFSFEWDKGLEIVTTNRLAWDKAKAIHYRKHPILPWPKPEIPEYVGSTDLNFICLCHEVDSHNVILNFGADDCIPAIPNRNWWYILNTLSVTRLDNGEKITVYNGSYNTDRSRWCWSYSLTAPATEISKLEPIGGQPVILKIAVNGNEHHMLLENRSRSRSFANDRFTLTGRSQTALLDSPYSAVRSFLQENERTSVQLVQAEIDRASSNPNLNWQLIDELGWIVANQSLSYNNLSPIAAIKLVAESGGGFIYSEKGSNTLSIKPQYKKTYWDSMSVDDYDRLIPESIVLSQSTDYEQHPNYNAITLTNDRTGATGQVKRTGTAGDVTYPSENNPLFNHVSMTSFGKSKLAKAGMVETHTFDMPINADIGECAPGEVLAFNAEFWGIIDSVSVSFTNAIVKQTIKVERVNNE